MACFLIFSAVLRLFLIDSGLISFNHRFVDQDVTALQSALEV